jgi:hypothetical protein
MELRKLALDNPDSWVRLAAVKLWIEYGYGKPLSADGENAGGPVICNVERGLGRQRARDTH